MMFTAGYVRFGSWGGAPLRWHWSLPLVMAFAGQWSARPLSWILFLGLVLAHQAGHHAAVARVGVRVIGFDLQGLGGEVRWSGSATPNEQVLIAWSGVLSQLGFMLAAKLVLVIAGGASEPWLLEVEHVGVTLNAILIAVNLLPIPSFDGEVAWKALSLLRGRAIPERHRIVLHVVRSSEGDEGSEEERVRAEVEAELAEITRAHNDQAEAGRSSARSSRWS